MLGSNRYSISKRTTRALKFATIIVVGGCVPEECDDPTGPDVQASVTGRVTLNGAAVPGVTVSAAGKTDVTGPTGQYSMWVQGESFPLLGCVTLQSEPYRSLQEVFLLIDACFIIDREEDATRIDWAFTHVAPTLEISFPDNGSTIGPNVYLTAVKTGSVTLDGGVVVAHAPVRWASSRDGDLGGAAFGGVTTALSVGTHTLSASYTDHMGANASDMVTVDVTDLSNEAPVATITAPESGLAYEGGVALDFAGSGADPEEGALTAGSLTWASSQEGVIGTGTSFSRIMAEGSHVVILTATDAQGASGADTILIHINAVGGSDGTIQGTVSIGGFPLSAIAVALSGAATASTTTDATGAYVFSGLAAGTYTITITPPPGTDILIEQTVTLGTGETITAHFTG